MCGARKQQCEQLGGLRSTCTITNETVLWAKCLVRAPPGRSWTPGFPRPFCRCVPGTSSVGLAPPEATMAPPACPPRFSDLPRPPTSSCRLSLPTAGCWIPAVIKSHLVKPTLHKGPQAGCVCPARYPCPRGKTPLPHTHTRPSLGRPQAGQPAPVMGIQALMFFSGPPPTLRGMGTGLTWGLLWRRKHV